MDKRAARRDRLRRANALLAVIRRNGRGFFAGACFVLDDAGRLWWMERDGQVRVWLHVARSARLRGFSGGGTLRALLFDLRDYIWSGEPVRAPHFGPWPAWYCDGDPWGYGESMRFVRRAATRLGITPIQENRNA